MIRPNDTFTWRKLLLRVILRHFYKIKFQSNLIFIDESLHYAQVSLWKSIIYIIVRFYNVPTGNFYTPPLTRIFNVILKKDPFYDDFGFSLSDGLYEKGVYINRIRKGGPAHRCGLLMPFDRILQVRNLYLPIRNFNKYFIGCQWVAW